MGGKKMLFYDIIPKDTTRIPLMCCIGYSDVDCAYGPIIRDQYIVHYVVSGKGTFNGLPVEAGQGFLITPGMMHEYRYDEKDPWAYLWFKSYDKDILPLFEMHEAVNNIFNYKNREEILAVVNRISSKKRGSFTATQIGEFFIHIFNECIKSEKPSNLSSSQKYCEWCKKYIDLNIDKSVSVATLCELLGITQPYLFKIFKSELGISPKQYIIQRKIKHAKSMLSETDTPISTVALSLGFYDTIAFSKFFKSVTGISPTAYRQNH